MIRYFVISLLLFSFFPSKGQDSTVTLEFEMIMTAWKGDSSYCMRLLKEGADVNSVSADGISALIYAVQGGHYAVARILVANGADMNYKYPGVKPALIVAVLNNHFDIARYLLHKGAIPDIGDGPGNTPLIYAVAYQNARMVKLLLAGKADPGLKNTYGESPLWYAAYNGDQMAVYELLLAGADINTSDRKGHTPLMLAAMAGDTSMLAYLTGNRADVTRTNLYGQTAMDIAVTHSRWESFKYLSGITSPDVKLVRNLKKSIISNGDYHLLDSVRKISRVPYLLPFIGSMSLGYGSDFAYNDMMFSPFVMWHEKRYRMAFRLGWSARYWRNRVEYKTEDAVYQFWERRNDFYGGIEKKIRMSSSRHINQYCFYAGIQANYSVVRYRGVSQSPDPSFIFSPYAGWARTGKYAGYGFRYMYYPTGVTGLSPHRLGAYFTVTLYNRTNKKYLTKCSLCD
jgi:hypothetical protein